MDDRVPDPPRPRRGIDMEWVVVTVLGFLAVLGGVIAMARSSTARWERDRRSIPAPRGPVAVPVAPPPWPVVRLRRARARAAGLVRQAPAPIRIPLEAAGRAVGRTVLRPTDGAVPAESVRVPRPAVPVHGVGHALPRLTRRLAARLVHPHRRNRDQRAAHR